MSFINRICDKVYVINLEKEKERLKAFDTQMSKNRIKYDRFNAILGANVLKDERLNDYCNTFCTDGMKGCALSHRSIWEDVVKKKYQNVLICEDDAMISDSFDKDFQNAYYHIPKDYDVLYLGCLFGCKDDSVLNKVVTKVNGFDPKEINEKLVEVKGTIGLHCYMVSLEGAKKLIANPITFHVDVQVMYWIQLYNYKSYALNPLLVDSSQDNSSMSDTYPKLLNSVFKNVEVNNLKRASTLDWVVNESFLKIGMFNINYLILMLMFLLFFIPKKLMFLIYVWLLIELIYSKDFKNTFRYFVLLSIPVLIKHLKN
jgi:GR25 family glycosyltransferase involved in LPS biosynthesis